MMAEIIFADDDGSVIEAKRTNTAKAPQPFQDIGTSLKPSRNLSFATGVPHWGEQPETWDNVRIDGTTLPGLVRLEGHVGQRFETREVPGENGSKLTRLGYEAAKVSIRITLVTEAHLRAFEKVVPLFRPRASNKSEPDKDWKRRPEDAFEVEHPALALYGLRSFICERASLPEQKGDGSGMYEVKLELLEYVNQEKAGTTVGKTKRTFNGKLVELGPGRLQVDKTPAKPSDTEGGPA